MKTKFFVALALVAVLSLTMMATASAALPTGMSWVKYSGNPVAPSGLCGVSAPTRPAVLVDSGVYKMYFTDHPGNDGVQIYYATSANGGLTWICGNGNSPVLTLGSSGAWDAVRVATPAVIKDGATYKMWYSGRNAAAVWQIGYATSLDGVAWTKSGSNPVLIPGAYGTWDSQLIREASVVKVSGTYHMWYSGTANWPYFKIGHATSTDGTTWVKDGANPVLAPSASAWDSTETYAPSVVMNSGVYEMFYSGSAGTKWVTGHASSTDGTVWTKDGYPILTPSAPGWDNGDSLDYVAGVLDSGTWKVFYSGAGASSNYQIGLATLQSTPQLTFTPLMKGLAVGGNTVVTIDLTSVTNLYGYQFQVTYDSSKLSAVGAFVNSPFDTTTDAFTVWNADCSTTPGVCKFAVTKQSPATAISGSPTLAQITFTGVAPGLVPLNFTGDILSDRDGNALTHTKNTGWLDVYSTTTLSGVVQLQGRATPIDAGTVTIYEENGAYPAQTVPFDATTGAWTATVGTGGTYDLVAAHSLYLSNRKNGVSSGVQPTTTLKGGDANNSGKIDIADLSLIGGEFGKHVPPGDPNADINKDLDINILDLVLAGGNYGLSSPQGW